MRTSLALFASAMLAAASLVLADEGRKSHHSSDCDETPTPTPAATFTASYIPYPASVYPIYKPTLTPASSVYSSPESVITASYTYCSGYCGPATLVTSTTTATCTTVPPYNARNSTLTATASAGMSMGSYIPPPGPTSYPTAPSPTPTPPVSTGGAAPMGVSFTAGIIGAVGVLFALL